MVQPATRRLVTEATLPNQPSVQSKVSKGSLVIDVRDYGASGGNTQDDTTMINNAIAAAVANGTRTTVLFPANVFGSSGYKTTDTIVVPGGVDLDMRQPIIYAGASGKPALVIGEAGGLGLKTAANHRVRVRRSSLSSWTNEADIGVKFINQYWATIWLPEATNFTIGAQLMGDGYGVAYCNFFLGTIKDNKIGLDLTNANSGWCNENKFFGGSWQCSSTTYTTLDRTAVRITSSDGSYLNNNNNIFYSPSFEIQGLGKSFLGLCVDAVNCGPGNRFLNARQESCSNLTIRTNNLSRPIYMHVSYDNGNALTISELGTYTGSVIDQDMTFIAKKARRNVFSIDGIHKKACLYNSTSINVPFFSVQTNATTIGDARFGSLAATTGLTLNTNYLVIGANRMIGRYVSTKNNKRFTIAGDFDSGFGGRYMIRCHASDGSVISTANTIRSSNSGTFAYATTYGGAWSTGLDGTGPKHFTVSDAVDYIFIGVRGGTNEARLRSLSVYALDSDSSSWLPWEDFGENYATEAPASGTWELGRRLYNANPTTSGVEGWVCVAAGTPGTWRSFGSIAPAVNPTAGSYSSANVTIDSQGRVTSIANGYTGTGATDIEITDFTKGVILKSPNGTRWRVTVNDTGNLVTTSL